MFHAISGDNDVDGLWLISVGLDHDKAPAEEIDSERRWNNTMSV